MQCPSCNASLKDGSKFCEHCGSALPRVCLTCGYGNSAQARFCSECGAALAPSKPAIAPSPSPRPPAPVTPASSAERRQLTIMFCDMVGSSALSTRLDPEEQRDVVSAFQTCCANEIKGLDGMVAQYLGDGVLAYFGYPTAHEDDAERAVRAGLAILDVVGTLQAAPGVTLQARIGIASGVVVVGDLGREGVTQENAAIGETTNLAARLQSLAEPNTMVIAPETHRLVGALFEYRDLGSQTLKGFGEPLLVRQVIKPSKIENRFEVRRAAMSSRLLGRDEELDLLWRRWEQAKRGEGRVVLVTGEPGIGKSRLTRALQERLRSEPYTPLLYHCSPYHQDSALYPIIGQLIRAAGIERDDAPETKLDKLEVLLRQSSEHPAEDMPLFAALLSIPGGDRYPLPKFTPQRIKERTLASLLANLKQLAAHRPVLMVFEDVHWIDPTSLELLSLAIDQIKSERILILATARPEFTAPWPSHRHTSSIGLTRLDKMEGEALIAGVTGKSLPRELLDQIVARTDGVPLFIEELTMTVLESGLLREADGRYELTGPLPPLAIPSTLHASLLARLDRLASAKDVAQIGAAIGREFSYTLISAVAALPARDLNAALAQLVHAELIFQRGAPPDATYQFKHALVQDAAYASLVRSRRQQLHGLIGHTLVEQFPETADIEPEIVAHHYAEAGLPDAAINYWQKAGERAVRTSAYVEAVKHITNGIDLLQQLPSTMARMRQELEFHIALGGACIASKGYGVSETGAAYARAYELSRLTEDASQLPKILAGRFVHYHVRADVRQAQLAANELLAFARGRRDAAGEMMAHRALGDSLLHVGDLRGARAHFEEALRILGPQSPPIFVGEDVRTAALAFFSICLALQGYVSAAEERAQEAMTRARSLQDPHTLAFALSTGCRTKIFLLDHKGLVQDGDRLHALAIEHSLKWFQAQATNYRGWAMALEGRFAEGIALLQFGIEGAKAAGAQWILPFHGAMLATAYQRTGRVEDGLTLIRTLLEVVERTGVRYMEAELYRVRGELLVSSSNLDAAEEALHRGLTVAREQEARIFEMRIATTLARMWRNQGHSSKARDLLTPICDWFGEIPLAGLKDAKEVLHTLRE
jgi:class 3 adenylate cyclase/tetratricopeptide (TPR) repeat protein